MKLPEKNLRMPKNISLTVESKLWAFISRMDKKIFTSAFPSKKIKIVFLRPMRSDNNPVIRTLYVPIKNNVAKNAFFVFLLQTNFH